MEFFLVSIGCILFIILSGAYLRSLFRTPLNQSFEDAKRKNENK